MQSAPPPCDASAPPTITRSDAPGRDRAPRLPAALRSSLRDAVIASFGTVPDAVDLDSLGLQLVEAIGFVVSLKARDIHSSVRDAS